MNFTKHMLTFTLSYNFVNEHNFRVTHEAPHSDSLSCLIFNLEIQTSISSSLEPFHKVRPTPAGPRRLQSLRTVPFDRSEEVRMNQGGVRG